MTESFKILSGFPEKGTFLKMKLKTTVELERTHRTNSRDTYVVSTAPRWSVAI